MNRILETLSEEARRTNQNLYHIAVTDRDFVTEETEILPSNPCNDWYSVAKAFTATAVGLLYDRGLLSLEDKVTDILKGEAAPAEDERWNRLTLRHALTHRCGLPGGYLDIDVYDLNSFGTNDLLSYLFRTPLGCEPGTEYCYTDAAYYLLARVAEKVSGMRTDVFLWKELLSPLGVREAAFSVCPLGHVMGATGMYMRAGDVSKLGAVYANGGYWKNKRLLSGEWIREATENRCGFNPNADGLIWAKGGMYGQQLAFAPSTGLGIAWHGFKTDSKALNNRMIEELSR